RFGYRTSQRRSAMTPRAATAIRRPPGLAGGSTAGDRPATRPAAPGATSGSGRTVVCTPPSPGRVVVVTASSTPHRRILLVGPEGRWKIATTGSRHKGRPPPGNFPRSLLARRGADTARRRQVTTRQHDTAMARHGTTVALSPGPHRNRLRSG